MAEKSKSSGRVSNSSRDWVGLCMVLSGMNLQVKCGCWTRLWRREGERRGCDGGCRASFLTTVTSNLALYPPTATR